MLYDWDCSKAPTKSSSSSWGLDTWQSEEFDPDLVACQLKEKKFVVLKHLLSSDSCDKLYDCHTKVVASDGDDWVHLQDYTTGLDDPDRGQVVLTDSVSKVGSGMYPYLWELYYKVRSFHNQAHSYTAKLILCFDNFLGEPQPLHLDAASFTADTQSGGAGGADLVADVPLRVFACFHDFDEACTLLVRDDGGKESILTLQKGDAIVYRGDLEHAGAGYFGENAQLFMAVATKKYSSLRDDILLADPIASLVRASGKGSRSQRNVSSASSGGDSGKATSVGADVSADVKTGVGLRRLWDTEGRESSSGRHQPATLSGSNALGAEGKVIGASSGADAGALATDESDLLAAVKRCDGGTRMGTHWHRVSTGGPVRRQISASGVGSSPVDLPTPGGGILSDLGGSFSTSSSDSAGLLEPVAAGGGILLERNLGSSAAPVYREVVDLVSVAASEGSDSDSVLVVDDVSAKPREVIDMTDD